MCLGKDGRIGGGSGSFVIRRAFCIAVVKQKGCVSGEKERRYGAEQNKNGFQCLLLYKNGTQEEGTDRDAQKNKG